MDKDLFDENFSRLINDTGADDAECFENGYITGE